MMGSEGTRGRSHSRELERLQNMVRKLGIDSDGKGDLDGTIDYNGSSNGSPSNGYMNGSADNDFDSSFDDTKPANRSFLDKSLHEINEYDLEDSLDHVQEDSWLCESPLVSVTSPKSPYVWLKEDINTPELRRARPSLITKLDYIGIQNRDEQLEKIISQHGYSEERPGRLYHSASFASMMSLDWDYENEDEYSFGMPSMSSRRPLSFTEFDFADLPPLDELGRNSGQSGIGRRGWSDNHRKVSDYDTYDRPSHRRRSGERGFQDYEDSFVRQPRKISYEVDDPYSYQGRKFSLEFDDPYDVQEDLDPLNLEFESPPVLRRSVVAPNPAVTKRSIRQGSPARSRSPEKYSDFAEDDLIAKPRGKVRPRKSKYTFERSDSKDSDSNPNSGQAVHSDQSDLDSIGDQPSPRASRSSSRGSLLSDDMGPVRPRGAKDTSNQSSAATTQVKKRSPKPPKTQQQQPQIRPRGAATDKGDASLKVKLPQSSAGGPVIRRRGAGPVVSNGASPRPSSPLGADSSSQESLTMAPMPRSTTSTPKTRQSLPQPRRSGAGTGIPTPRGNGPRVRRSASPDVTPRRSASPDSRPRPRRGPGVVNPDTSPLATQSWQGGMY